jgi:DNA-binding MarR family transcriptional regulator
MAKIPQETSFFNTKKHLVRTLGPYEAILLAYVAEWEAKNLPCFASRKHISEETGFSEKTIQNLIKKLADAGYLTVSHDGRKRVISLTSKGGTKYPQRGHNIPPEGVRDTQMRGYEILNTKNNNTKNNITNKKILSTEYEIPPLVNDEDDFCPFD